MARSPSLTAADVAQVLADYDLGGLRSLRRLTGGSVGGSMQTNLLITTTEGRYALKYYTTDRSLDSVCFETRLAHYLRGRGYPCPAPLCRRRGGFAGIYREKPCAIFTFLEGRMVRRPNAVQLAQLVQRTAELHLLTRGYRPAGWEARWNYNVASCRERAASFAKKARTPEAELKGRWIERELETLMLPPNLPKGVCHADLHYSNLLFEGNTLAAMLDFDDANYTYLTFDLANLMGWHGRQPVPELDFTTGRRFLQQYESHRPLNASERRHFYDVVKLSLLVDGVWGDFDNADPADLEYRIRTIARLNALGREAFYERMFG